MRNKISQRMSDNTEIINNALDKYFTFNFKYEKYKPLIDSVKYSVFSEGKRIRPYLTLEFNRMCRGEDNYAVPYACAMEMVHTYSLIHDDLPCMDNDDLRRGKPTNHVIYGESTAMLAGDALLTHAFETITENEYTSDKNKLIAIKLLAECGGMNGMIGGQQLDLIGEEVKYDFETLKTMQYLKTGRLLIASCVLGCLAAEKYEYIQAAEMYGEKIGLAFQIIDDILDVTSDAETLGKNIGSDKINGKTTFLSFMSIEEAYNYAGVLTEEACKAISQFADSEILCETARYLLNRKK